MRFLLVLFLLAVTAFGQQSQEAVPPPHPTPGPPEAAPPSAPKTLDARKKFVLDVVNHAVALPQPDPQDRLRVLAAASQLVAPWNHELALKYSREGVELETQLVASGQTPAVSMLEAGQVDCSAKQNFVESVPVAGVPKAEQSLLVAVTTCPKSTLAPTRRKLEDAMNAGYLAPRALLATMQASGIKSQWSQEQFEKLFSSLPKDAAAAKDEAPNFAAMYSTLAPDVDKDVAQQAGLKLLEWLGHVPESGERNLSVNMATAAMKQVLGDDRYNEALRSNVMAGQVARTEGQEGEIEHPDEENVSVMKAMGNSADQTEALRQMPPSRRAREAAANGFAAGTSGNRTLSDKYFDMAFSAADEVWDKRAEQHDAVSVIEEVCEAAAQVDAVHALRRAQGLQDASAQAIGMLAVARVVDSQNPQAAQQ